MNVQATGQPIAAPRPALAPTDLGGRRDPPEHPEGETERSQETAAEKPRRPVE